MTYISFRIILFGLVVFVLGSSCWQKPVIEGDIAVTNGTILDGTGSPSEKMDLVIRGDSIAWLGDVNRVELQVDTILDASGMVITPGFIDMHAHGDPLQTADFTNFLAMGVTSICLGMDGSSSRSDQFKTWLEDLEKQALGVHILPFIGHGTLRSESGIGLSVDPSVAQINGLTDLLSTALDLGVWGLSMGLEYFPGYYADSSELGALARVVGTYDGIITSHIRNEDNGDIEEALQEMIDLASYCRVNISHIKVVYGKGSERADDITQLLSQTQNKYAVTADIYPYTASYTGIGIVFPEWARVSKSYADIRQNRGEELASFLRSKVQSRNGPESTLFGNGPYKGRTLKDLEQEYNLPFELILRDIIGPYGSSAAFFVMDEELQTQLLKDKNIMIGSDGSPTMHHPRGYGSFSRIIERYVMRDSVLTLDEAVRKMTSLPAKSIGLSNRGQIRKGFKADILVFKPGEIRSNANFDQPHLLSTGMTTVIVDGEIAYSNDQQMSRNGQLLKKLK